MLSTVMGRTSPPWSRLTCLCSTDVKRSLAYSRHFASQGRDSEEKNSAKAKEEDNDSMFSADNLKDLSPLEVARMRVTYGLLKEHVQALEQGVDEVPPEKNPLIDPRSFGVRKLPILPKEILRHFRQEIPPDVAAVSKPVYTHGLWEAIRSEQGHELLSEANETTVDDWNSVDERSMDTRSLSRMRRQDVSQPPMPTRQGTRATFASMQPQWRRKKKMPCPLKDENGRVNVDFRAIGSITPFLSDDLKIQARKKTGVSAKSQRKLARAVKTARTMALISPEPKPHLSVEEMLEIDRNLP